MVIIKIHYQTSAKVHIVMLSGLTLFTKNRKWFAGIQDLALFRGQGALYCRVHGVLTGIIYEDQLRELYETGTTLPAALSILQLYFCFAGQVDPELKSLLVLLSESCRMEAEIFGGEPMAYFHTLASWSATPVDLRLDGYGRSVCKGESAVRLTFFVPEVVSQSSARIWFLDGDKLVFLGLSGGTSGSSNLLRGRCSLERGYWQ